MDVNKRRVGAYRRFTHPESRESERPDRAGNDPDGTPDHGRAGKGGATRGADRNASAEPERRKPAPHSPVDGARESGGRPERATDTSESTGGGKSGGGRKPAAGAKSRGGAGAPSVGGAPPKAGSGRDSAMRKRDAVENAAGLLRLTRGSDIGDKPRRKVAELLVLLGKEEAAGVLRHLDPETIEQISAEIAQLESVGKEEAAAVLAEFGLKSVNRAAGRSGGAAAAREILDLAFGAERGAAILEKVVPGASGRPFDFMVDLEPAQIQLLLRHESAPVISLILAHLPPRLSAAVLSGASSGMPSEVRREVIRRIARMQKVDMEVLARIEASLKERLRTQGKVVTSEIDGKQALAQILRHLAPSDEKEILDGISSELPELGDQIRERLFTIDTLLAIDDSGLQMVLRDMADRDIAVILKGRSDEIRSKIMRNVSARRQTFIMDEYHQLGPMPKREVDKVTKEFIALLRQLEDEGDIVVRRGDERYI